MCCHIWRHLILPILTGIVVGCIVGNSLVKTTEVVPVPVEEVVQPQTSPAQDSACTQAEAVDDYYNIPLDKELQEFVVNICKDYQFQTSLIYGIMYVESSFQADAISPANCIGLMQVSNKYAGAWLKEAGYTDPGTYTDPYINIVAGIQALSDWRSVALSKGTSELQDILEFYNKGYVHSIGNSSYNYASKVLEAKMFLEGGGTYG